MLHKRCIYSHVNIDMGDNWCCYRHHKEEVGVTVYPV